MKNHCEDTENRLEMYKIRKSAAGLPAHSKEQRGKISPSFMMNIMSMQPALVETSMLFCYGLYSAKIVLIVSNLLIAQLIIRYNNLEAFQSVHHVTFILCYTVLYNFLALVFALIRVRKLAWDNITQGKAHLTQT